MRGTERRVECNRGAEFDERFGVPPPLLQHDAEIVMDERAIPAPREHIAKRAFGAIEVVSFERVYAFGEAVRQSRREIVCAGIRR